MFKEYEYDAPLLNTAQNMLHDNRNRSREWVNYAMLSFIFIHSHISGSNKSRMLVDVVRKMHGDIASVRGFS